jgi:hypothetical protein
MLGNINVASILWLPGLCHGVAFLSTFCCLFDLAMICRVFAPDCVHKLAAFSTFLTCFLTHLLDSKAFQIAPPLYQVWEDFPLVSGCIIFARVMFIVGIVGILEDWFNHVHELWIIYLGGSFWIWTAAFIVLLAFDVASYVLMEVYRFVCI